MINKLKTNKKEKKDNLSPKLGHRSWDARMVCECTLLKDKGQSKQTSRDEIE